MTLNVNRSHFGAFLSTCRRQGTEHVSLFGSAIEKPLSRVGDLDVHVVVPRMTPVIFRSLAVAGEAMASEFGELTGRECRVELRHGPFKPEPSPQNPLQLHLLIDDRSSLERAPCLMLIHRAATARILIGAELEQIRSLRASHNARLREARTELKRWRRALQTGRMTFRHWICDPQPRFVEGEAPAATPWELICLLRGAARTADLHYIPLALAQKSDSVELELISPMLSDARFEDALPERIQTSWSKLCSHALSIIDARLEDLGIAH